MIHIHYNPPEGGKPIDIRRVSPVQSRRGAERFERELRESLFAGEHGQKVEQDENLAEPEKRPPLLSEFANEFQSSYVKVNNKPSTADTRASIFKHHLIPFFGKMRLDRIGPRELERYKAAKVATHSPKTINNHLSVLHKLLATAAEWGLIEHVPKIQWLKSPKPEFRFLDFGEAERLLDAAEAEPSWYAMILMAMRTGLRQGELLALRWDDVDLVQGQLVVRRSVTRGRMGTPKSGRSREVPLSPAVVRTLKAHRHLRGELVFCQEDGNLLTKGMCKWPLTRARRKAGLKHFGWHDLRHTFASHLVMKGVQLKAVQELLGHSTIEMTMRYAHLAPSVLQSAVLCLDDGVPSAQHNSSTQQAQERKTTARGS